MELDFPLLKSFQIEPITEKAGLELSILLYRPKIEQTPPPLWLLFRNALSSWQVNRPRNPAKTSARIRLRIQERRGNLYSYPKNDNQYSVNYYSGKQHKENLPHSFFPPLSRRPKQIMKFLNRSSRISAAKGTEAVAL